MNKSNSVRLVAILLSIVLGLTSIISYTSGANAEENTTQSDCIIIKVDYNGGILNGESDMTLTEYPKESFGLLSPSRQGYIFGGWEVVIGDTTVTKNNDSYIVVVGEETTLIRAIWEKEDGSFEEETPDPTILPTEKATERPTEKSTEEPTVKPKVNYVELVVEFQGGEFNGESVYKRRVEERNTVVLFENVDLIRREGYKVSNMVSQYGGSCIILEDKQVVYIAPSYATTPVDVVKVNWVENNDTTENVAPNEIRKNTVYVNLEGGIFKQSGNKEAVYYVDENTTSKLFNITEIVREGYTLEGFEISNGKYVVQNMDVILLASEYSGKDITLKAVWKENLSVTETSDVIATALPIDVNTAIPTEIPVVMNTATPTVPPLVIQTQSPTTAPSVASISVPTVIPETVKLTVSRNTIIMGVGEGVKINATATQNAQITYETKNNVICGVTSDGVIVGRKKGNTKVVVRAGKTIKTINVCVLSKPKKIGFTTDLKTKVTYTIKKGKTKQIRIYFYKNSYSNKITFKSSDKKVATVTSIGKVKAKKKGTCKITVITYNGKKAVATIKIK